MRQKLQEKNQEDSQQIIKDMETVAKFDALIHHSDKTDDKAHATVDDPKTWWEEVRGRVIKVDKTKEQGSDYPAQLFLPAVKAKEFFEEALAENNFLKNWRKDTGKDEIEVKRHT